MELRLDEPIKDYSRMTPEELVADSSIVSPMFVHKWFGKPVMRPVYEQKMDLDGQADINFVLWEFLRFGRD